MSSEQSVFTEICSGLAFPEGPIALPDGAILVTEVVGGRLTRVEPDGRKTTIAAIAGSPAGAAIGPDGRCYVCNGGGREYRTKDGRTFPGFSLDGPGRVEVVDLNSGRVDLLYDRCAGKPLSSPNDLVFDATGGFWFTDHGKGRRDSVDRGWVCYARPDGSKVDRVAGPMVGPNGIGLSPDGSRLYVAETGPARVWAFDIEAPGSLKKSNSAVFRRVGHLLVGLGGYQMLDSLAVDREGWVCVATLLNGGITSIAPDGGTVEHTALPDAFTTNLCFGGESMRTAFVTLSSSGRLVSVKWPRAGLPLNF